MNVSIYVTDVVETDGTKRGTIKIVKNPGENHMPFQLLAQDKDVRKSGLIFSHVYENDEDFLRMSAVSHPVERAQGIQAWIGRNMSEDSLTMLQVVNTPA
jgi:hypothetical protein